MLIDIVAIICLLSCIAAIISIIGMAVVGENGRCSKELNQFLTTFFISFPITAILVCWIVTANEYIPVHKSKHKVFKSQNNEQYIERNGKTINLNKKFGRIFDQEEITVIDRHGWSYGIYFSPTSKISIEIEV